jgi:hypothetical protein
MSRYEAGALHDAVNGVGAFCFRRYSISSISIFAVVSHVEAF